jgi:hypothetical protein
VLFSAAELPRLTLLIQSNDFAFAQRFPERVA